MTHPTERVRSRVPLLHAYCHLCQRWRLLAADSPGLEWSRDAAPAVARCPDCGEYGLVKVRPPATRTVAPALRAIDELPSEHWRTRA
jgi:DNA-directed RNA polymerase subunit RPC12/RpoP